MLSDFKCGQVMHRRDLLRCVPAALLASHRVAATHDIAAARRFPDGFLWGVATSGYQVEGNSVNADIWLLEHVKPTIFSEASGDACDSYTRWREDLDLVSGLGLNAFRFSLEWSRIEPEPDCFSLAMLEHYRRIVDGCLTRGLSPVVSFSHFALPRWFAARGGWLASDACARYARYCERAARHLGDRIGYALTFNEPNIMRVLRLLAPSPEFIAVRRAMLKAAARATGGTHFTTGLVANDEDVDRIGANMIDAHRRAYVAIKSVRPEIAVGASISLSDDQAADGSAAARRHVEAKRRDAYGGWLRALRATADFIGVQNYDRSRYGHHGLLGAPAHAQRNHHGVEIYPRSLGNAVHYAHMATGKPVLVTENGLDTEDDALRAAYIPAALAGLHGAIADGVPVLGYLHWSLLDNYEWSLGYAYRYGLFSVDRQTFVRTRKASAEVLSAIAMANAVTAP
ncbi:glycoside hydrolase family 1 protein [Noviherbaspirillum pedocola]|uniref:Glycoside hydrolase family 1 protein n=1 Tax=Noviherbaspirillum pedocola TaxID=2801341 RepID=A0A934T3H0_9BURK|nr:family 1 glycosylhydrolase [Noviherbaspirillum pedocola]MBK4737783.1 glycoside hydrolase family 1 protein [Noviherbaspirillum pedocola]